MDGNNRYAKQHALPSGAGHWRGKDALDPLVEYCREIGIQVLTVFAFSSENWARPQAEIALLMQLLQHTIHEQLPRMHRYGIRLRFIGERTTLSEELQTLMHKAEQETATYTAMTLVIAVSYGGQWDIAQAAKQLAKQVAKGELSPDAITAERLGQCVALADLPAVDMLIRTGGEWRLSNFLLWQAAYAELFFTQTLWPDFAVAELQTMLAAFATRERRFGKTSEQLASLLDK